MQNISLMGFDLHKIVKNTGRKVKGLYIGGVLVDGRHKFLAHSDGDILIHAIIDAISSYTIGKDIGQLFPDSEKMYKNYPSEKLLEKTLSLIDQRYKILYIDAVIVIDKIKIAPIKDKVVENLKKSFPDAKINIKGKRTEGGFKKNYGYCWVICNIECI